ncbi:hypothetical protein C4544_04145 [candidate division WS5 bacterium]|uniref:Uncharacterized protein n=1 Tax=candidate division WS5 bacterium TaxID=2093353 RepID=A0A419DCY7_9BACT|nr:MAG: hypothetical protein C4544_04145 [candidate division WS5 bacterium]
MTERGRQNSDAYEFLEDDKIQDFYNSGQKELVQAFESYHSGRDRKELAKVNSISSELRALETEMLKRGLLEEEIEEDTTEADEYNTWREENDPDFKAEKQVEATNRRMDMIREENPNATVRRYNFKDFDSMWDEANKENQRFTAKKEQTKKREEIKEGKEKEASVLREHREAYKRGDVESEFKDFGELRDQADKDNEAIDELRLSAEYKVEKGLEEVYDKIKKTRLIYSERLISYKRSGFLERLNPRKAHEAGKNRKAIEELDSLKHSLTSQEVSYINQKKKFAEKLEGLPLDSVRDLSNMSEGSNSVKAEFDRIRGQLSILEENHRNEKSEILWRLNDLGVDVLDEENIDNIKLQEIGVVYESRKDTRFQDVRSETLSPDEEIFRRQEEKDLSQDAGLQRKMKSIENKMRKNAKENLKSGVSLFDFFKQTPDLEITKRNKQENKQNMPEIDKQIQREIERYKRKIIESRIRIRRLTKIIEEEKQKGPEEMDLTAIGTAMKRLKGETVYLKRHSEEMRQKVILVNQKSRLTGLLNKVGINVGAKENHA